MNIILVLVGTIILIMMIMMIITGIYLSTISDEIDREYKKQKEFEETIKRGGT